MATYHVFAATSHIGQGTFDFVLRSWPAIIIVLLITLLAVFILGWLRNFVTHSAQQHMNQGQKFSNLYERIHNYQQVRQSKMTTATADSHNNATTNNNYHHAIKLLQRGMDTNTLVEYCNLTQGEAELLQAVYGSNRH